MLFHKDIKPLADVELQAPTCTALSRVRESHRIDFLVLRGCDA